MLRNTIIYAVVNQVFKSNGSMNKTLYKETLEDELERAIEYCTNKLFLEKHQVPIQYDNNPKHTFKSVKEHLKKQPYNILEWLAQFPDLKPQKTSDHC